MGPVQMSSGLLGQIMFNSSFVVEIRQSSQGSESFLEGLLLDVQQPWGHPKMITAKAKRQQQHPTVNRRCDEGRADQVWQNRYLRSCGHSKNKLVFFQYSAPANRSITDVATGGTATSDLLASIFVPLSNASMQKPDFLTSFFFFF